MATQDVENYVIAKWKQYREPVTELSKEQKKGTSLVVSDMQMYNFDKITKDIYATKKNAMPTSADALTFSRKHILFVEFKSGFKKKVRKNALDKEKAKCKKIDDICPDYWKIFFKNQESETIGLINSLQMKAADSYITLEKQILPKCEGDNSRVLVDLWVIIDEEEIDYMEDTLASLANKTIEEKNNIFERIRKALNRFLRQQDANGNRYYYESIHVLSARDYENYLKTVEQEKGEVGLCT